LVAHRTLPVPTDERSEKAKAPATPVENARSVYDKSASQLAWAKRRDDLHWLADVGYVLSDVDRQIAELQHRFESLLNDQT